MERGENAGRRREEERCWEVERCGETWKLLRGVGGVHRVVKCVGERCGEVTFRLPSWNDGDALP